MQRVRLAKPALADDLVWGVPGPNGIAAFLGLTPPKVYYLIREQRLPVRKLGRVIVACKSQLRRVFEIPT